MLHADTDALKLTVLGKSPAWQDTGGASSGYLLEAKTQKLLLDCGNGVLAELQRQLPPAALDGVLISHLHADHFFDLIPLAYMLTFAPPPYGSPKQKIPLYVPPGAKTVFRTLGSLWSYPSVIEDAFEIHEYALDSAFKIGSLDLQLATVPHFVTTSAISFTHADRRLVFGADCGPNQALVNLASGADLLIAEATMPDDQVGADAGHMSARQAGEHATAADVFSLLITHYSELFDPLWITERVAENYTGSTLLATPQMALTV